MPVVPRRELKNQRKLYSPDPGRPMRQVEDRTFPQAMRKKLVPLFAIAFVVAVISTAVFYSLFATRLSGAPATRGPQSSVVIATRDLTPGTVLSGQDVRVITWTGDQPPAGVYSATEQVAGKTVFQPVSRGEPLTEPRLAAKDGTGIGVPEGMRAVSVHVSDSSGVVALLKPGYKVDVQMFERPQAAPGKAGSQPCCGARRCWP